MTIQLEVTLGVLEGKGRENERNNPRFCPFCLYDPGNGLLKQRNTWKVFTRHAHLPDHIDAHLASEEGIARPYPITAETPKALEA